MLFRSLDWTEVFILGFGDVGVRVLYCDVMWIGTCMQTFYFQPVAVVRYVSASSRLAAAVQLASPRLPHLPLRQAKSGPG